ncbi:TPA: hypothetical protein DEB29_00810 [Candidatus Wolfebacteria bacterium]|nr:hypothetical protein [Candidatus Wolfebacteria bacterium]
MSIDFFSTISELDTILFAKHLSVMSRSGISLSESVETLIAQTASPKFKKILEGILADLENGQPLSKGLVRHPKFFGAFYTNLIEIGERSGNLSQNLDYLAKQLAKNHEFRTKIKGAAMYPAIVLSLAIVVGIGVSVFALPKLVDLFSGLDVVLPLNTRILIAISVAMRDYGLLIFGVLLAAIGGVRILLRLHPVRMVWHMLLLRLPIAGPIIKNTQLALMCRGLGAMIGGGIPIITALRVQRDNTSNLVYQTHLDGIINAVNGGGTLSRQFSTKEHKDIPPIVGKVLAAGEKSGTVDELLVYLGDHFEGEVDEATKLISIILEPLLLFIITTIVGFIALSIIAPIYQLTGSIQ